MDTWGSSCAPEQVNQNTVHLALNFENKDGARVSFCMPNKGKLGGKHVCDGLGVSSAHFKISMLQGLNICFTSIVHIRHDTLGHPTTNQKDQFKAPCRFK